MVGANPSTTQLSTLSPGSYATVRRIGSHAQASRLREIGLCEGQELEVLCAGDPMICRVGACRVGICVELASEVHVATPGSARSFE